MRHYLYLGMGIVVGVLIFLVGWKLFSPPYQFHGSLIDPAAKMPDFQLVDDENRVWKLSEQKGKVVVIFFGYTSCPDVCPLTLSKFKQVKTLLSKNSEEVEFVYITVDPERDSPERLHAHIKAFDPEFIGLTGGYEQLEPIWKNYGVYRQKVETESAAGYLMDHSATTYVIDNDGALRLTFPYGMDVSQMAKDIAQVVNE